MPPDQGKSDRSSMFTRARIPHRVASTTQEIAQGKKVLVTAIRVVGTTGGRTEFRSGGSGGDPDWEIQVGASEDGWQEFPAGLLFEDGVHVTQANDEIIYFTASE